MAAVRPRQGQQFTRVSDGAVFVVTKDKFGTMGCLLRYVSGGVGVKTGTRRVGWKRLRREYTAGP